MLVAPATRRLRLEDHVNPGAWGQTGQCGKALSPENEEGPCREGVIVPMAQVEVLSWEHKPGLPLYCTLLPVALLWMLWTVWGGRKSPCNVWRGMLGPRKNH